MPCHLIGQYPAIRRQRSVVNLPDNRSSVKTTAGMLARYRPAMQIHLRTRSSARCSTGEAAAWLLAKHQECTRGRCFSSLAIVDSRKARQAPCSRTAPPGAAKTAQSRGTLSAPAMTASCSFSTAVSPTALRSASSSVGVKRCSTSASSPETAGASFLAHPARHTHLGIDDCSALQPTRRDRVPIQHVLRPQRLRGDSSPARGTVSPLPTRRTATQPPSALQSRRSLAGGICTAVLRERDHWFLMVRGSLYAESKSKESRCALALAAHDTPASH